ncbi:diacylglycerol kinase family lipid kinase [Domibacillus sp. A3M-37]|uniref:diacylglycerol/lipid kinase family protein n=1 Tax=Domibacillus sp. A3M-37 TaxID=2962037 RepID=UPI0020B6E072|nr:diacylglycerol kinase family protein [Domibacillus sp. A3M-37]MCP3764016.1 diacylglycerol kinase family lipid kinase [Domibacillus sp. A3M-37]
MTMHFNKGLLLYNEQAGKGKVPINEQIVPVLKEAVEHLEEQVISAPGEGEKICFERGSDYDIIILYGGDGTIHECVNGIARLENGPVVAVLPGGTCNDFSRAIGVPEEMDAACRLLKTGGVRHVDLGLMNDRYFVNFWGIGMITDTSENIDENKKTMIGKMSYYLSALETIRNPPFFHYMIEADGVKLEGDAVMAVALNGNYIGTINLPFEANHEDGYLDLIIVKESGFSLIKEVIQTEKIKATGKHAANLEHHRVRSFTIATDRPMRVDMDGEVYTATPSNCSVKKGHVRFVSSI